MQRSASVGEGFFSGASRADGSNSNILRCFSLYTSVWSRKSCHRTIRSSPDFDKIFFFARGSLNGDSVHEVLDEDVFFEFDFNFFDSITVSRSLYLTSPPAQSHPLQLSTLTYFFTGNAVVSWSYRPLTQGNLINTWAINDLCTDNLLDTHTHAWVYMIVTRRHSYSFERQRQYVITYGCFSWSNG